MTASVVDRAPLECTACAHRFIAEWERQDGEDWRTPHTQACPACGHAWSAVWPGFKFSPRLRVMDSRPAVLLAPDSADGS
jgi:hypothetical protein